MSDDKETRLIGVVNRHFADTIDSITGIDVLQVVKVAERFYEVSEDNHRVFVLGNGGSQAAAAHLVLHLREHGILALDLMADTAALTAIANDVDYDAAAWKTIYYMGHTSDDVLVIISGSGTSKNCVYAAERFVGDVIGITGVVQHAKHKDEFAETDFRVAIPTDKYGPMEDATVAVIHAINETLKALSLE